MARSVRDSKLETRTARLRLPTGKKHWRAIGEKLSLGYRRAASVSSWYVRYTTLDGREPQKKVGEADDHKDANGANVLTYFQAVEAARNLSSSNISNEGPRSDLTVTDIVEDYLAWFRVHRKSHHTTKLAFDRHVLPSLGTRKVTSLTTSSLRRWHENLASAPARHRGGKERNSNLRSRKATSNRILSYLKAALNHSYHEGRIQADEAWRRVKAFRDVETPKVQFLTEQDATSLINACAEDFRPLVKAALLTGCRYGEMTAMRVGDFNATPPTIFLSETKNGKPRHVPLNDSGAAFFEQLTKDRNPTDWLFLRADGNRWKRSQQSRPLRSACDTANIERVSFHILRHTYGSALAQEGVPLQVIAELLGHSDTRITSRHYAHLTPDHLADAVKRHLPSFGTS